VKEFKENIDKIIDEKFTKVIEKALEQYKLPPSSNQDEKNIRDPSGGQ